MQFGYLFIETNEKQPDLLRIGVAEQTPDSSNVADAQPCIRYIARFNDSEAALMHTHELLKRHLLDADQHLYRLAVPTAIAAVESLDLKHGRLFIDPLFDEATEQAVIDMEQRFRRRKARKDRFFQTLGYIAVGMLLLHILLDFV